MVGHIGSYFVVLSDGSAPEFVADHFSTANQLAHHPSGRPWLLGVLPPDQLKVVEAGTRRLAVIGRCPVGLDRLQAELDRLDDVARLDRIARSLPGSFHLVALVGERIRVQGSASGLRRVFHASVGSTIAASDRSDVLARLLGAQPDPAVLALRMLSALPHPLGEKSVWPGVESVPAGHCLDLDSRGRDHRLAQWWEPPEPELDLAAGALALREALTEAVSARTSDTPLISADLSGGLDSTPLCTLAAAGPAPVVAMTMASDLDTDDDLYWAQLALRGLPALKEHVVYSARELPSFYADLYDVPPYMDEPSAAFMSTARILARFRMARDHGSHLHLDGLGGDQVLIGHPALYHDMLRKRPFDTLRRVRNHQLLARFPTGETLRSLADRRSHQEWFAATRRHLASGEPVRGSMFGWDVLPSFGPWFTDEARRNVLDLFDQAQESLRPLASSRGRHADLARLRNAATEIRLTHQVAEPGGPTAESPFLDDRVVEACLRVRPQERATPFEFKPLVKAAMAGIMPDEFLRRRTKTDGAPLAAEGFDDHSREITQIWQESRMAELGVLAPDRLLEMAAGQYSLRLHDWNMEMPLSVELWIRSQSRSETGIHHGKGKG